MGLFLVKSFSMAPVKAVKRPASKSLGGKGKKKKTTLRFQIDCTHPVEDGIMDVSNFEKIKHLLAYPCAQRRVRRNNSKVRDTRHWRPKCVFAEKTQGVTPLHRRPPHVGPTQGVCAPVG